MQAIPKLCIELIPGWPNLPHMCSAMQAESHKEYLRAGSQLRNQLIALCQGLHELGDALLQLALLLQGNRQLRLQLSSCVLGLLQLRLHSGSC